MVWKTRRRRLEGITAAEPREAAVNPAGGSGVHQAMDYLVIGAGPAGLQLGYFLQQAGRDYLTLEAGNAPGTFFRTFSRHRSLISINKPHTGEADPECNLRIGWNWTSQAVHRQPLPGFIDRQLAGEPVTAAVGG
jgi:choline dehydrogenase-like flavoprotein